VTAISVSNSTGVAIFMRKIMQTDFKLYKVDMKYISNLHRIDDKILSASPRTRSRVFMT
jgi:protein AbiQ